MVYMWYSFSITTLRYPPIFTVGVLDMLGCVFLPWLGVGSLSLVFLCSFGFDDGGISGLDGVIMTELNRGERLGALSGLLFSPLDLDLYHTSSFPYFQKRS